MTTPLPPFTLADLQHAGSDDSLAFSSKGYLFQPAGVQHLVRPESMALLDPRLPVVIEHLTFIHQHDCTAARQALAATLRYWANPAPLNMSATIDSKPLVMDDSIGAQLYVLDRIQEVTDHAGSAAVFDIWYFRSTIVTHAGVTFAAHITDHYASCPYYWCDLHFPGSVTRLKAAFALALDGVEAAQFGFYPDTMPVAVFRATTLPASMTELLT